METTNILLEAALSYAKRGWHVFPVHSTKNNICTCGNAKCGSVGKHPIPKDGFKSSTTDSSIIKNWWTKYHYANIGIATGKKSGFFVLDIDDKPHKNICGSDELRDIEAKHEKIPDTPEVISHSGGRHIYFACNGHSVKSKTNCPRNGLDIRGEGGYIIAPPSHIFNNSYEWEASSHIDDVPLSNAPAWLVDFIKEDNKKELNNKTDIIPEGKRNDTLIRIAGSLHRSGVDYKNIFKTLCDINNQRCHPSLSEKEIENISKSAVGYDKPHEIFDEPFTDTWNSKVINISFGSMLKFCEALKGWHIWNDRFWELDKRYRMVRFAQDMSRKILRKAYNMPADNPRKKELIKHAIKMQSESKINSMINLLKSEDNITHSSDEFDFNPWLLNCNNGTLNLKTNSFYKQKKDDLITMCLPIDFNINAKCPHWMTFLDDIFEHDYELIKFIQRAIGYSLSGDVSEDCLFMFYGAGGNGKTTFLTQILRLLGKYAITTPAKTLLEQKGDAPLNDIARLKGHRFVSCAESGASKWMDEARIKQLTGGDKIPARFLYQEYFEFYSTFKIFFATNNLPIVSEFSHGIWRRLVPIPFNKKFEGDNDDKFILDKFENEKEGILSWAIKGFYSWFDNGLGSSEAISQLKKEYKDDSDVIGMYIKEYCYVGNNATVPSSDLWENFKIWYKGLGYKKEIGRNYFYNYLKSKEFEYTSDGRKRIFKGIGLLVNEQKKSDNNEYNGYDFTQKNSQIYSENDINISKKTAEKVSNQHEKVSKNTEVGKNCLPDFDKYISDDLIIL